MAQTFALKTKLTTPRFDETRDWYRDLFGLAVLEEWNEPGDEGCILGLSDGDGQAFLEIDHGPDEPNFAGLSLQFRVDDVDRFVIPADDRFSFRGPEDRAWGSRYLFFTDPNDVSVIVFSGSSL